MPKTSNTAAASAGSRKPRAIRAKAPNAPGVAAPADPKRPTRASVLIEMMRAEGGASAQELAAAVGWQVHSVRGFISGTPKKQTDLNVATTKVDGVTRYAIRDVAEAANG